jgi:hypothetical protein
MDPAPRRALVIQFHWRPSFGCTTTITITILSLSILLDRGLPPSIVLNLDSTIA